MAIILPYLDDDDDDFSFDKENNKKKERVVYLPSTSAIVTSLQQWKYILFIIIISFTRGLNIFISLLWTLLDFFFIFSISFNVLLSETS